MISPLFILLFACIKSVLILWQINLDIYEYVKYVYESTFPSIGIKSHGCLHANWLKVFPSYMNNK